MQNFHSLTRRTLSKVPQATAIFWITKILTTGMGEATSDYLAHTFNPILAVAIGAIAFAVSLVLQFSAKKYNPWIYWLTVVMVSVFGTMAADVLHVGLGIPYIVSTIFYAALLTVIFILWYRYEGTLSIVSITSPRREIFYWAVVLFTFALGTALGDLTATTFNLGYLTSGILFLIIIAIPAVAYWKFGLNEVAAFWFAYIVTRPLGASFADWLSVAQSRGGLNFGDGAVSLTLSIIIFGFVAYLAITHKDIEPT